MNLPWSFDICDSIVASIFRRSSSFSAATINHKAHSFNAAPPSAVPESYTFDVIGVGRFHGVGVSRTGLSVVGRFIARIAWLFLRHRLLRAVGALRRSVRRTVALCAEDELVELQVAEVATTHARALGVVSCRQASCDECRAGPVSYLLTAKSVTSFTSLQHRQTARGRQNQNSSASSRDEKTKSMSHNGFRTPALSSKTFTKAAAHRLYHLASCTCHCHTLLRVCFFSTYGKVKTAMLNCHSTSRTVSFEKTNVRKSARTYGRPRDAVLEQELFECVEALLER